MLLHVEWKLVYINYGVVTDFFKSQYCLFDFWKLQIVLIILIITNYVC